MAIYFFDKNQTLIKIVPESATFEAIQTQELDDESLLKDTLSVTIKGDEKLLDAEYMAVKSYKGNAQTFDMYRIVTDTTPDKSMSFTGMSLAPYELNGHIIQDLRPANHSLSYTLNRVLDGTDWRVGYIDDSLSNVTTTFYYVSAKESLKELQSLVGCEFVFKVEISGQKITDKWIEVYKEMGNRTKKRFNYGTNALTVVRETNKADIYTALIGRGKGEEVSSGEENESGQAGYGRKITFEEIEWSTANGNPLNKPIGQYYLELPQATQAYGIKNIDGTMKARVGIVDFDDEEDKNKLINLTYQQLLVSSRPKVLFKTTVANVGATGIGDTVTIHRHDLNIHYQTRVRKIVRNKLNDNKTQIELGDAAVTPSTKQTKQNNATIKNLNSEIEKIKANVTTSQNSADGKNTIFYGSAEPTQKRTGDTWYKPHPSIAGETQMLAWNGTAWELVIDTSDLTSVSREVQDAISKAEEAKALAVSEAESALTKAKADATAKANAIKEQITGEVNTAISTAEDAKALAITEAENALALAKADATAKVNAIHEQVSGEVNTAISTAEDAKALAVSEAESALTLAKADATAKANAVKTEVSNSVSTAIDTANDAKETAASNYTNAVAEAKRLDGEQKIAFDNRFTTIQNSVDAFNESFSDVDAKADDALAKAGANANLLTTHQNMLNTINNTTIPAVRSSAQDALSNAKNAMDEAKKTDGKIADYVTKNGLVSGTTVDSKINTATGEISKKITTVESDIKNLDNTNLFSYLNRNVVNESGKGTLTFRDDTPYGFYSVGTSDDTDDIRMYDVLDGNGFYTISFDMKGTQNGGAYVNLGINEKPREYLEGSLRTTSDNEYHHFSRTIEVTNFKGDGTDYISFNPSFAYVYLRNIKVQKGKYDTGFTTALADQYTQHDFQIFESTYDEDVKGINSTLTDLSNKKLDGKTYTDFYNNDYKKTAQGVTDTWEAVNKIVDENGNTTDTFAQAVYERNAERQKASFNEVTKDLVKEATYTAGINGISSKITTVEGKVDGLKVGGRNLLIGSQDYSGTWVNKTMWTVSSDTHKGTLIASRRGGWRGLGQTFNVFKGEQYTFSAYVKSTSTRVDVYLGNYSDSAGLTPSIMTITLEPNTWKYVVCTFSVNSDGLIFPRFEIAASDETVYVSAMKLEKGNVATDWSLAPEDMATVIKTNEIERTADYSKMAITNLSKNGVVESSSVNATKDGITEKVAKVDANGNISYSNRDVKLNSIITTIADQQYISQQVQGSNIIQNTIATIVPAGANLLKNSDFRDAVTGVTFRGGGVAFRSRNTYPAGWGGYNGDATSDPTNNWHAFLNNTTFNFPVVEFNETDGTRHWKGISQRLDNNKYAKVNPNASYMFSVDTYSNGTGTQLFGGFYYTKKGGTSPDFHAGQFSIPVTTANKWERLSVKVPLGSDADLTKSVSFYIYGYRFTTNSYLYIKNVSLTEGDITAGWSLSPEDTATQSQITQLDNNINVKVSKSDLISQFNIQAGGVLITSGTNKLNITPETTFIEDATIKSAMIDTVTVDKITGTNAQFTTMITKGLTADVITSNMIKADDAMFTKLFATSFATTKLAAQGAWITDANIASLDAGTIKSGTIDSARIDAKYIVTNGLTTDVVESKHIKSSTGLIDKIFADEAYIKQLTGKTAFIEQIKAVKIDASKITSGTIATARLDATAIFTAGLTANAIKSDHIEASVNLVDKLFATEAYITALTSKSIFAQKIKAIEIDASKITSGELAAARIKSKDVVTQGLTADVVKSTHIKSEVGLVDKIFSTTAYIEELTNKTVFTEKIQAININADKITTGTLDASKVSVVNLDANNITANKTSFIQSNWNDIESSIKIDGSGLLSTASDSSQVYLQNGIVGMRNPSGASIGQIGYRYAGGSPQMNLFTTEGSHFSLVQRIAGNDVQTIYITNGGKEYHNSAVNSWFNSLANTFSGEIKIMNAKNLTMSGGNIINPYQINLQYGGKFWSTSSNSDLNISSSARLFAHSNGSVAFYTDSGYMYLERHLSMQNNNITNQSDRRLKHDIKLSSVTALQNIKSLEFVDFKWNSNGSDGYGLIAQDSPSLMEYDQENDIYMINSSKQLMMTSQAVKELAVQTDSKIEKLEAKIANLQDELAQLKGA